MSFRTDDPRPAMKCDDVKNIEIAGFNAQTLPSTPYGLWFDNVDGAYLHSNWPEESKHPYLYVEGKDSNDISVINNNFSRIEKVFELGTGVKNESVNLLNNQNR